MNLRRYFADFAAPPESGLGRARMSDRTRHLATAALGTVASRLVWLIAIPVVARLYSPGDVGTWPLVTAVAAIIAVFGTLRFDIAITVAHYTPRARILVFATIAMSAIAAIGIATLIAVFPAMAAVIIGVKTSPLVLFACPAYIVLYNISVVMQAWLLRSKAILAVAIANAANSFLTVAALALFAFVAGPSPGSFVAAYLVGLAGSALLFCIAAIRSGLFAGRWSFSARAMWSSMKLFRQYPLFTIPQSLIDVGTERLVQLWIGAAYSVEALGAFYLIRQTLVSAVGGITGPIGQVAVANLARMPLQADRRLLVTPLMEMMAGTAGLTIGFGFIVAPEAFSILLGPKFEHAAEYSAWLVLGVAILLVAGWSDRVYYVARRSSFSLAMSIVYAAVVLCSIPAAYALGLDVAAFVAVYATALFVGNCLYVLGGMAVLEFAIASMAVVGALFAFGLVIGLLTGTLIAAAMGGLIGMLVGGAVITLICASLAVYSLKRI
jgi:O-antigen/teichoic acid export membrane protein